VVDVGSYGSWYPVQEMSYYPFGMSHPFVNQYPERQNFKFGDKELDEMHGLKRSDFHARQLSSVLGIWDGQDELAEKYYRISPYAYVAGNPVNAIDKDGRKITFLIKSGGKTASYEYRADGNLRHEGTGKVYNGKSISGHAGKIVDGYNKMLKSGDKNYVKQITTLINSKNVHVINATVTGNSGVTPGSGAMGIKEAKGEATKGEGIGTTSKFDFSESEYSSGLGKTNYTVVAHEVQHQYDFDQGNMADAYDESGNLIGGNNSPAEQRAMENEDTAREQEGLEQRRIY
jgi:RHS repeat-associated protein